MHYEGDYFFHFLFQEPLIASHLIKTSKLMKKHHCLGYYKTKSSNNDPVAHIQWFYTVRTVKHFITFLLSFERYLLLAFRVSSEPF